MLLTQIEATQALIPSTGVTAAVLSRLRQLTAINAHGEAYALAADALGHTELVQEFKRIESIRSRLGYLSEAMVRELCVAYEKLMVHAKAALPEAVYRELYLAT